MLAKITNFLLKEKKGNWKIFFFMPIVSALDLGALFLFTKAITSDLNNYVVLFSIIAFFALNLIIQIYSIGFFAHYSYSIVQKRFSSLYNVVSHQIPARRRSDDFLQNFFSVEYFRICERILLPFIVVVSKGLTAIVIFLFILVKNPLIIISVGTLIFAIYFAIFKYIRPEIDRANISISKAIEKVNNAVNLLNSHKFESQIYNITNNLLLTYSSAQKSFVVESAKVQKWSSVPRPIIEFLVFVGISLSLTTNKEWQLEELLAVGMGCLKIINAVQTVYYSLTTIRGNISALDKYEDLQHEALAKQNTQNLTSTKIDLSKDYFLRITAQPTECIQSSTWDAVNCDIKIKKGQKCALVGPSGAGKTTFLLGLLGLSDDINIELSVNGHKLPTSIDTSKSIFGFVPQYPVVFEGTLRDNLNLYSTNNDQELKELIKTLNLSEQSGDFFSLEKSLGFRGNNISGGQAQRICLARALLANREILLLDEVTSALDSENTKRIVSLLKNMPDLTILWVTHDKNVIESMDQVFKISSQ